jgi:uncharacterized membrane protein
MSSKITSDDWKDKDPDKKTSEMWKNEPNNWKWGMFYFNKEDKRVFVPKKVEWMGITLNFANPKSVFFLIGFLSFFAFIYMMILFKY